MSRRAERALEEARVRMAQAVLGAPSPATVHVGEIALHPHQSLAVDRLRVLLANHGGAMLADPVGLGKTFASLAIASTYQEVIVVAPAALRAMWHDAARRAVQPILFVSMQSLSRGIRQLIGLPSSPGLVIVDEAHHLRSRLTNRYAALAALCVRADVLLLSATPVQNRREDLVTQLALFLGSRATSLGDDQLAEFIVRRKEGIPSAALPGIDGPHALSCPDDDDVLEDILALPISFPAADEGVAGALATFSLVHLWASSRAALVQSLRRRRAKALAMSEALHAGRVPSRHELGAWAFDGSSLQLAFSELVLAGDDHADPAPLRDHVEHYLAGIAGLLERVRSVPDPDPHRAKLLETVLDRHAGERIVVFTQYAETASAMWASLRHRGGLALMTARGGRISSGAIPRADILSQFDPANRRSHAVPTAERIDMLISTDVLSEGVNLHAASVVVHLDLPWNPARLEQRVGRLRRLGSPSPVVHVYIVMPPTPAERLLRIETRLRAKLGTAARSIGTIGVVLPRLVAERGDAAPSTSAPEAMDRIRACLRGWIERTAATAVDPGVHPCIGGVAGGAERMLVVVHVGDDMHLLGGRLYELTTDPREILPLIDIVNGAAVPVPPTTLAAVQRQAAEWIARRRGKTIAAVTAANAVDPRSHALTRISRVYDAAPRHRRSLLGALAADARDGMDRRFNAGAERALDELTRADMDEERWLRAVSEFGAAFGHRSAPRDTSVEDGLVAAIVVVPPV